MPKMRAIQQLVSAPLNADASPSARAQGFENSNIKMLRVRS